MTDDEIEAIRKRDAICQPQYAKWPHNSRTQAIVDRCALLAERDRLAGELAAEQDKAIELARRATVLQADLDRSLVALMKLEEEMYAWKKDAKTAEAELSAARADARTHALEFAGYLSGALPELHAVEVGRIYAAYEEFAARAALSASSAPAPKCPKCGMLQSECDAQREYDERIPPVI